MVVRLPTPKVDLSESILDPTEILGLGDIQITHPDALQTLIGLRWPPRGGDGIIPLPL